MDLGLHDFDGGPTWKESMAESYPKMHSLEPFQTFEGDYAKLVEII